MVGMSGPVLTSVPVPGLAHPITYDPTLPISLWREEIARTISEHQVVVIAGETGSGKTTQIPKICLELGRMSIGHTQPRRIAARSVAERVAEELKSPLGELVGYQVRFTRKASAETRVKIMTDGVLLAEIGHDRDLRRYDTLLRMRERETKAMSSLATRMRLTQQSQMHPRTAARAMGDGQGSQKLWDRTPPWET